MPKKVRGREGGSGPGARSEGGCEHRIEVILKMQKVVGVGSAVGGSGGLAGWI